MRPYWQDGVIPVTTQTAKPRQEQAQAQPASPEPYGPIALRLPPNVQLTDDLLAELSSLNDALRLERNAQGELEILPPANPPTGRQNSRVTARLDNWAEIDDRGEVYDSSTGFTLPNGAIRSPDACWIRKSRLEELTEEQKEGPWRICPDFVIEIRSSSDTLRSLQRKMEEYIANGARLGWLIDPIGRRLRVYIYRPGADVEILERPESISGEPELPGFVLDLEFIWRQTL